MTGRAASRRTTGAICALALALVPTPAQAHLNATGMGPLYDGLVHFATSPEDVLPALALALWAGLRGAGHGRRALFALPISWFLGGLVALAASATTGTAVVSALWILLLGGLLAADARLSPGPLTALAAGVGFYHGYLNGAGMGPPATAAVALVGLVFAVFALVALAAALVVPLRAAWARIAVRVVGSWIAASGLLLLGWAARRG